MENLNLDEIKQLADWVKMCPGDAAVLLIQMKKEIMKLNEELEKMQGKEVP